MKRLSLSAVFPLCAMLALGTGARPDSGKIPITTTSEAARKEFLQGRTLAENLRLTDAIAHFDRALRLDPAFASAELARANVAPTAKDFREHLDKAIALSGKASEGERLTILAAEAAAVGNTAKTREYLEKSVTLFPQDERARFALGVFYAGQQENDRAIEAFKTTITIAPEFPPVYNNLGYAYKTIAEYGEAEKAFRKYAELIPQDPNPYDSYAELLMKMGRFEESVAQYQKAIGLDPNFISARVGSAIDALYLGKPDVATAGLEEVFRRARTDGERRTAVFVEAVVYADQGKFDQAVGQAVREYGIAEKIGDVAAMTADLNFKANILLGMGKHDEALATFNQAHQLTEGSSLAAGAKRLTGLFHHANVAAVAIARNDLATARSEAEEFRKGTEGTQNRFQLNLTHELTGRIALAAGRYDEAISELLQSNLQDPYNLYRLALAYKGKGDQAKARDYAGQAANWNGLPALNYALVRNRAAKMAAATM